MLKPIIISLLSAAFFILPVACGGDDAGEDNQECISGKACDCSDDSCSQTCGGDGASCDFNCGPGQDCSFSCPGGGCTVSCQDSASCDLDCAGDACGMNCSGTDDCQISACTTGCALDCGGAETCSSTCDELNGGCTTVN